MANNDNLQKLLEEVAEGKISPERAAKQLSEEYISGYAELIHTKLDLHRQHRRGVPEAIFCAGKTREQVLAAVQRMDSSRQLILCTRVKAEVAHYVMDRHPGLTYDELSQVLYKVPTPSPTPHGLIAVLSAGTSDQPVAEEAALCAELMGNRVERIYDVGVAGLHRLVLAATEVLLRARVVICVAGMEGALPSVVAGLVACPVIAVPTSVGYGASFGGVAALLGMLNSCSGGVAVVNIDNGFGAALTAHLINHVGEASNCETKE